MAFVTGLLLIDAPASALNNLGSIPGERYDNSTGVKIIRARDGQYPYVSAQAFRYWLRATLERAQIGWQAAPVYREDKVAYTDANPILYWDDDLFGYMRAPSTKASAVAAREADVSRANETPTKDTITRIAPFRVGTLVSISPVTPTSDWGVMARHDHPKGPVPYEHQFYRATLKGLFSLDLRACGTFWYRQKTGFRNLDDVRVEQAVEEKLTHLEEEKAYRLPLEHRLKRVQALFEGMAVLDGGAKQTLHYTDVAPALTILAVTKGGNHIFGHVVGASGRGLPEIKLPALHEALTVFKDDILSDIYVGWVRGYLDEQRAEFEEALTNENGVLRAFKEKVHVMHPREAFRSLKDALGQHSDWLE